MNVYKGIKVADSVKLYKKDGSFNKGILKSLDVFVDKLAENDHELLTEYVRNNEKVLIDFNCNHKPHEITPNDYKNGYGCPRCGGKCPEQAKENLMELLKVNRHEWVEGKYVDAKTKILIDFICDHKPHWITPSDYKSGYGCPECGIYSRAETRSRQAEEELIILIVSNEHEWVAGEYVNNCTKICIDFNCGHVPHWIVPDAYKRGIGCPKCGKINMAEKQSKRAREELISLLESNGHEWIEGEYVNIKNKILIDFKCGHKPHLITPHHYKNGHGCPICNESKGEKRVRKWLDENVYTYDSQEEFDGLVGIGGGLLSYDFFLPKQNLLIEYQGEQHEKYIEGFHKNEGGFKRQQEHDKRKREYAEQNNIELLEIWYYDFDNVEDILYDKLIHNHVEVDENFYVMQIN